MTPSYRIGCTTREWIIERRYVHGDRSRTPGRVEWRVHGHYGNNLERCAQQLLQLVSRENYARLGPGIGKLLAALSESEKHVIAEVRKVAT